MRREFVVGHENLNDLIVYGKYNNKEEAIQRLKRMRKEVKFKKSNLKIVTIYNMGYKDL